MANQEPKNEELTLKTQSDLIPIPNNIERFIRDMRSKDPMKVACLEKNEDGGFDIIGDKDSIIFIGYPFISKEPKQEWDKETKQMVDYYVPILQDYGFPFPLINLGWQIEFSCFACVRGDVYAR